MTNWLESWDLMYRNVVKEIATKRRFESIRIVQDISGASGARTFLVQPSGKLGVPKKCILKIGPLAVMEDDLKGLRDAPSYFSRANYKLNHSKKNAIAGILLEWAGGDDAMTFEDFYRRPATKEKDIERIVRDLFLKTLRKGHLSLDRQANPFVLYRFKDVEAHSRALREIGDGLPTLVRWWERAVHSSNHLSTYTSLGHGDLHRKNIIVSGSEVFVVDFGLTKPIHAMRDFAKLERDVCLFLYPGESGDYSPLEFALGLDQIPSSNNASSSAELCKALAMIITLRSAACNLLPQLSNWKIEYPIALMAHYIYAAGNRELPLEIRKLALCYAEHYKEEIERTEPDRWKISEEERVLAYRRDILWKTAYAFLRLDQLRSGGWGRSLPDWFEALVKNDQGTIARNPEMRTEGGTDLTSYAFSNYLKFLRRLGCYQPGSQELPARSHITNGAARNIAKKIGFQGGVGVGKPSAGEPVTIRVRHTAMGLLTFLYFSESMGTPMLDAIRGVEGYLLVNLKLWQSDTTHHFACFCILSKLQEFLDSRPSVCRKWLKNSTKLAKAINETLIEMSEALVKSPEPFELRPKNTCPFSYHDFHFRPYNGFWRMERSNLLMYLPFLVTEDGRKFHSFLDRAFLDICAQQLLQIIPDLASAGPQKNWTLLYYHRGSSLKTKIPPPDWGLTAELLSVLRTPAIKQLVLEHLNRKPHDDRLKRLASDSVYDGHLQKLASALEGSFDSYNYYPQLFTFTHGPSFAAYLAFVDGDLLNVSQIIEMDQEIKRVTRAGGTEYDLYELCEFIIASSSLPELTGLKIVRSGIVHLLMDKLVAGEHIVPDDTWWKRVQAARDATIKFFDGDGGLKYAEQYSHAAERSFVINICQMVTTETGNQRKALDMGCGPGQYAELLVQQGYDVILAEASMQMLKMARQRLKQAAPSVSDLRWIERLPEYYQSEEFDLIFACAMMVHIPREAALDIYKAFYQLLKPGGALFINFKIRDHSLVGLGNRYFEYYWGHKTSEEMLEEAGFRIRELSISWKEETMYRDGRKTRWANFYCIRDRE